MKSRKELRQGCADLLKSLRMSHKMSKSKMAQLIYVDDHTWHRYESGESAPTIVDFLFVFEALGLNPMRSFLNMVYPDTYSDLKDSSQAHDALRHYIDDCATDHQLHELCYLLFGEHGSSVTPQLEMITMYNHLPMEYRFAIADLLRSLYDVAEKRGELVRTDEVMPDRDAFENGMSRAKEAVIQGRNSYYSLK